VNVRLSISTRGCLENRLDPAESPVARTTRERVSLYVKDLLQANGTKTVLGRLAGLYYMPAPRILAMT
jgi:hypothetical protein